MVIPFPGVSSGNMDFSYFHTFRTVFSSLKLCFPLKAH